MYRTIIFQGRFDDLLSLAKNHLGKLSDDGSMFFIFRNQYNDIGDIEHDVFELTRKVLDLGLYYVNLIVFPSSECNSKSLKDNVKYILWVCRDYNLMFFNKNPIREKSIWKDVEWGKRAKNYNSLGKDPTNVWIPTQDDGKANITNHIILSDEQIFDRLIKMTESEDNNLIINNGDSGDNFLKYHALKESINSDIREYVVFGTSEKMSMIKDGSCQLVVTSPPYWDLKDYYKKGQIGQESFNEYLSRINTVFLECYNKLNKLGTFCININIRTKKKEVFLIPKDYIDICKKIGFHFKSIVIWHKSSGIPTSNRNLSDHYEFILVFSKSVDLYLNDSYSFNDYKDNRLSKSMFWNLNRKAGSVGKKYIHPAIYPNELSNRCICLFSNQFDIVVDPFLGSGTTIISAINNMRSCFGYEFNEGFEELIRDRISKDTDNKANVIYVKNSQ